MQANSSEYFREVRTATGKVVSAPEEKHCVLGVVHAKIFLL